jgi:hypothetical protein
MGRRIVDRIRRAVRERRWEVTEHALLEAEADGFDAADIRHALIAGTVRMTYTHDVRGVRYLVCGRAVDARAMNLVCRFTPLRDLRVITVFADEDQP